MRRDQVCATALGVALGTSALAAGPTPDVQLDWISIDPSGGKLESGDGSVEAWITIGQPDAWVMSGMTADMTSEVFLYGGFRVVSHGQASWTGGGGTGLFSPQNWAFGVAPGEADVASIASDTGGSLVVPPPGSGFPETLRGLMLRSASGGSPVFSFLFQTDPGGGNVLGLTGGT